jgi:ATP/maltotriose-dependent transcriptional regulator MalT
VLEAMRGDFGLARELLAAGRQSLDQLGLSVWAAVTAQEAFFVEMLAGDPAAAAATLRRSDEALREMGERSFRSTIAGLLAHALCALGEDDEAERFSRECEESAADEDVFSQVLWRSARAKVLARRGEAGAAEAAAGEAVAIADRTDLLNTQADALLDLAEVLALAGRAAEARDAALEAAERFERKGNLPSLARARALSA